MSLDEMAAAYHEQASESDEALGYYIDGLGLSTSVFEKHQLGWITEPVSPSHGKWTGMSVIPYMTAGPSDMVVALRAGAIMAEKAGRFDLGYIEHIFPLTSPRLRIYNVGNALPGLRTTKVHMVEKIEDVLRLRNEGERAVGIPGFQNFHDWWAELFMHSEVVIHHDQSKPEAVNALQELLRRRRITFTEHVPMPVREGTRMEEA